MLNQSDLNENIELNSNPNQAIEDFEQLPFAPIPVRLISGDDPGPEGWVLVPVVGTLEPDGTVLFFDRRRHFEFLDLDQALQIDHTPRPDQMKDAVI